MNRDEPVGRIPDRLEPAAPRRQQAAANKKARTARDSPRSGFLILAFFNTGFFRYRLLELGCRVTDTATFRLGLLRLIRREMHDRAVQHLIADRVERDLVLDVLHAQQQSLVDLDAFVDRAFELAEVVGLQAFDFVFDHVQNDSHACPDLLFDTAVIEIEGIRLD